MPDADLTVAGFIEVLAGAIPAGIDPATVALDINLDLGPFPSGEEGAEDWIMSTALIALTFSPANEWRGHILTLELDHS